MRKYELLFIISPNIVDKDVAGIVSLVQDHLTDLGVTITEVENLGRRTLAYQINHLTEGTYTLIQFDAQGHEIAELERRLRVMDPILRYLTVCLDDDLKRIERMKRKRVRRRARKAQRAPASGSHGGEASESKRTASVEKGRKQRED